MQNTNKNVTTKITKKEVSREDAKTRSNKECTAVAVLTQANAVELISTQWNRAQQGLVEIIKFGAMMMELECSLQLETALKTKGGWNKGTGLKAWLDANCPGVNYRTALGYRDAALGLKNLAGLAEDAPLLAIMDGGLDAEKDEAYARVMEAIAGASIGLLKDAKHGGDRKSMLPPETEEEKAARDLKAMKDYWATLCIVLHDNIETKKSHLALEKPEAAQVISALNFAIKEVKTASGIK